MILQNLCVSMMKNPLTREIFLYIIELRCEKRKNIPKKYFFYEIIVSFMICEMH